MKKFLLSLACVLGMSSIASAQTVLDVAQATDIKGTFAEEKLNDNGTLKEAAKYQPCESLTIDGYSFSFDKASGGTAPAYYCKPSESTGSTQIPTIRMYKNNTMTITCPAAVTKIEFTGTSGTANAAHTVTSGTISDVKATSMTWTGDAASFTITFAANFRISSMTVYAGGETPTPPTPDGTAVTSLKAAKALANGTKYILNCEPVVAFTCGSYTYVYDGESYALLYKANLGLNVGDKVKSGSTGAISIYNNLIELVPDAIEANGTATVPSPEVIPAEDLAATLVAANQDDYIIIKGITFAAANAQEGTVDVDGSPLTVKVYNRFNVPAKEGTFDMTGFIAIYKEDIQVYIVDLQGETKPIELKGEGEGTLESPYDCVRANDIVNNGVQTDAEVYVKGKVVSITTTADDVTKYGNLNYYISNDGTETDQFYIYRGYYFDGEKFTSISQLTAGCTVVVKGKLTAYNQVPQMAQGNQIVTLQGLEGIEGVVVDDANAPVEYFNLQGVRVAEPVNGLYIRRQGSKTSKVIF